MERMSECPFCGSTKVKLDCKERVAGYNGLDMKVNYCVYSVRCNACHARGGTAGGKIVLGFSRYVNPITGDPFPLPDWATTREALKEKAVKLWNGRAYQNRVCSRIQQEKKKAGGRWHTDRYWLGFTDGLRKASRIADGTIDDELMISPSESEKKETLHGEE